MTRARPDIPTAGTPEAKDRRVPRYDLSTLSEDQLRRRELVMRFGLAAYGTRWQTPLAEALGRLRQQATAPVQIAAWASGARPVPARVIEELAVLQIDASTDLLHRLWKVRAWPGEPDWESIPVQEFPADDTPREPADPMWDLDPNDSK
ncbi:hypothetical protein [Methylobacterium mesophilicum]